MLLKVTEVLKLEELEKEVKLIVQLMLVELIKGTWNHI